MTVSADQSGPVGERPPFGVGSKILYGIGAAAFGIKDNGFRFFLVFFYNQVVGLPVGWVTTALAIALAIDSICDPIIGQMSDYWRSKWGRRHPFMYAAILPAAILFILLWMPPIGLSQPMKLVYMVVLAIASRTFITAFEIPSSALAAEVTGDYDERTKVLGWRVFFAWWGGLLIYIFALGLMVRPRPGFPDARFDPSVYMTYALVASTFIALVMLVSSLGTHRFIPWLPKPPAERPRNVVALFKDMFQTLGSRHFGSIVGVNIFAAAAEGVGFSIYLYLVTFFWQLTTKQTLILGTDAFIGSTLALVLAPLIVRGRDKKPMAMLMLVITILLSATPLMLRLFHLFPENGSPALLPTLYAIAIVRGAAGISCTILIVGMIADVVEDSAARTGKRAEGLIFASMAFAQKCVSGLGAMTTGLIVSIVGLSGMAKPGQVPQETLDHLAIGYLITLFSFYGGALFCLSFYRIGRVAHAENLAKLAAMEAEVAAVGEPPVP
ncbi:Na+/melibiose symporter-like transporter [Caulobacter ginsengisoli]|uniref:Na+/melibiose symporter-like transporter n=1 Tax=Caulobacter ginsengisoli TaxID=400775 RepID=A0ABU0IT77_9CAUL|nr:MFS transporter [Caulobacter ginsengisoli]MDQ0464177.1 Na+/melibiose symporter-like transporter [Caulobacter ginsengisoli]